MNESAQLPLDVIAHVMACSPPSVIAALMTTCRVCYDEGPRHLLQGGAILRSMKDVELFTTFMFAPGTTRFPLLKQLEIDVHPFVSAGFRSSESVIEEACFMRLLRCPDLCLDTLILHASDSLFDSIAKSKAAFGGLTTIKHLVLRAGRDTSIYCPAMIIAVVQDLPAHLVTASISCQPFLGTSSVLTSHRLLERHADTLKQLRCNRFQEIGQSFLKMQTFGMMCDSSVLADLNTISLVRTFPNLSRLELIPGDGHTITSASYYDPAEARVIRRRNKGNHGRDGSWPVLNECLGEIYTLHTLGLSCQVTKLHIWKHLDAVDHLPLLREVLSETHPTELSFGTVNLEVLDAAMSTLREQGYSDLRTLRIAVELTVSGNERDGQTTLNSIRDILLPIPSPLRALTLHLSISGPSHTTPSPGEEGFQVVSQYALEALCRDITNQAPFLERLTVKPVPKYVPDWPDLDQRRDEDSDNDYDRYARVDHDISDDSSTLMETPMGLILTVGGAERIRMRR